MHKGDLQVKWVGNRTWTIFATGVGGVVHMGLGNTWRNLYTEWITIYNKTPTESGSSNLGRGEKFVGGVALTTT